MEVALGAIAIATAVKDIVELGQKIQESFAKVSKNLRNAKRAAEKIKSMVDKIGAFCDGHKDVLESDNMKEFREALADLHRQFHKFEASILPLLPKPNRWKLGPFIRGWWNNNKIEEHILGLQSNVIEVMQQHMMGSTMRIELKQEINHQDTIQGLMQVRNEVTQGLEIVRKEVSAIRVTSTTVLCDSDQSYWMTNNDLLGNITRFAQSSLSTSAPMLRSADIITEEVATAVYIKVQLKSIALLVAKVSTMPVSVPNSIQNFFINATAAIGSMSIMPLQRHVVRELTTLHDLLSTGHIQNIVVQDMTRLNRLSVALGTLNMPQEAVLIADWTVTLASTLANTYNGKHPDFDACLAWYLLCQSIFYYNNGNITQSLESITKAHIISQNLQSQHSGQPAFDILHSKVLLFYAKIVDNQKSLQMCIDALHILEDMLNVHAFTTKSDNIIEVVSQPISAFLDSLFLTSLSQDTIFWYADALEDFAFCLLQKGQPNASLDLWLLAIAVHQKLFCTYGDIYRPYLAKSLLSLLHNCTTYHMQAEQQLNMANECIQLFQELTESNPLHYTESLIWALWVKASALEGLGQDDEAIAVWEKSSGLARQIIQDSAIQAQALGSLSNLFRRLKRYNDAVQTGRLAITTYCENDATQALWYFNLSNDLQKLCHYKESAEAAKKSVALYQQMALKDLSQWIDSLAYSLSNLAYCLAVLDNSAKALIAWSESISVLDSFFKHIPSYSDISAISDTIERLCWALDTSKEISVILKKKEESLQVCSTAVQYLCQLSESFPQHKVIIESLLSAEFNYAYNMFCFGHLEDAYQYIENWLDKMSSKQKATSASIIAQQHVDMILLKVDILDSQGYTKEALSTVQDLHCIFSSIDSRFCEARLYGRLGSNAKTLQIAEEMLQQAPNSARSLHAVALAALLHQDYSHALEAAQKGCKILDGPNGIKSTRDDESMSFIYPSMLALLSFAEANLGKDTVALEHAYHAVKASMDMIEDKANISSTIAEYSYMEACGNLAEILLATGDHGQARKICEEQCVYFTQRVETRAGEYRELVPVLRMLGILCCSEGHCKEGNTAAQELSRIIKTLGGAFPSLQEQVRLRLHRQVQVPILKVLDDTQKTLKCGHQLGIDSLFAV